MSLLIFFHTLSLMLSIGWISFILFERKRGKRYCIQLREYLDEYAEIVFLFLDRIKNKMDKKVFRWKQTISEIFIFGSKKRKRGPNKQSSHYLVRYIDR